MNKGRKLRKAGLLGLVSLYLALRLRRSSNGDKFQKIFVLVGSRRVYSLEVLVILFEKNLWLGLNRTKHE